MYQINATDKIELCRHIGETIFREVYVDEIVIDANMDLQWSHRMSLMPLSPTCSALQTGFEPWTPYRVGLFLKAPCTQMTTSMYPQG